MFGLLRIDKRAIPSVDVPLISDHVECINLFNVEILVWDDYLNFWTKG